METRNIGIVEKAELPPDLRQIVEVWLELPDAIRAGIMALVGSTITGD